MKWQVLSYYETDLYKSLLEKLNEKEILVMNMRAEGYNYHEIARILGVSKQAVYRKVVTIKNIIKDIMKKID